MPARAWSARGSSARTDSARCEPRCKNPELRDPVPRRGIGQSRSFAVYGASDNFWNSPVDFLSRRLRNRMDAKAAHDPENLIAIVGMAGRFPGAADAAGLWTLLMGRGKANPPGPPRRWDPPVPLGPGTEVPAGRGVP